MPWFEQYDEMLFCCLLSGDTGLFGDNSGQPLSSLNLGHRDDVTGAYAPIGDSVFDSWYACDTAYMAQMLEDHYRVTDHAESFVTSTNADDVIDATGAGSCLAMILICIHVHVMLPQCLCNVIS